VGEFVSPNISTIMHVDQTGVYKSLNFPAGKKLPFPIVLYGMRLRSIIMNQAPKPPDVSIAPRLVATASITFVIALSLFTCRIYIRFRSHRLGKDDFALSIGMV
jgi:hypothetical protein